MLIQHSERDIRTTVGQAEALFTVLRTLRRPVRLLRVPEETHELTRSGTPFRRVENLRIVLDWFRHFLVEGKRGDAAAAEGARRALTRSRQSVARPRRWWPATRAATSVTRPSSARVVGKGVPAFCPEASARYRSAARLRP